MDESVIFKQDLEKDAGIGGVKDIELMRKAIAEERLKAEGYKSKWTLYQRDLVNLK